MSSSSRYLLYVYEKLFKCSICFLYRQYRLYCARYAQHAQNHVTYVVIHDRKQCTRTRQQGLWVGYWMGNADSRRKPDTHFTRITVLIVILTCLVERLNITRACLFVDWQVSHVCTRGPVTS